VTPASDNINGPDVVFEMNSGGKGDNSRSEKL
jgi:hypothetical protein